MKKIFQKRQAKQPPEKVERITNDTLAQHREQVLAGGRRFKYPVQYARHKLVINAILIGVGAVIALLVIGWWLLYPAQNTSEFMYRITRVIPVPVASVDGYPVRYSDYLMKYRSSMHYLVEKERVNPSTEDGQRQSDFVKTEAMKDAVADAYAAKLAKERDIAVTDAELEQFLTQQRYMSDGEVSERAHETVVRDYYGWSPEEYREAMKNKLLRQKVTYAIDDQANQLRDQVSERIKGGEKDLNKIVEQLGGDDSQKIRFESLDWLPRSNQDGGVTEAAAKLVPGQISDAIRSTTGEGYYFVKLLERNDSRVKYEFIQIPLTKFVADLKQASEQQTDTYIDLPVIENPAQQRQQ